MRGVLLGIRTEFDVLLEIADGQEKIGELLEEALETNEGLHVIYPLHHNYFVVYESNAALIGQMPDDLRVATIRSYLYAATLMNALRHNSEMEAECKRLTLWPGLTAGGEIRARETDMAEYAKVIKTVRDATFGSVAHLFTLIDGCELLNADSGEGLART